MLEAYNHGFHVVGGTFLIVGLRGKYTQRGGYLLLRGHYRHGANKILE
jgi:hypothetical protein